MTPRKKKDPNLLKLEKDQIIIDWLQYKNKAGKTRQNYLFSMKKFVEMTGLTPKQLVAEGRADAKKRYSSDMRVTKNISRFISMSRESGMRDTSIKTRLIPIYSFYEYYEIRFRREEIKGDMNPSNDEYPDKEMIRTGLKFANTLMKAIILVGASSGLSMVDIANLRLKDFKTGYDSETGLTMLKLVRIKTKFKFTTFLTKEATNAVIDYLVYRQRKETESMDEDSRKQLAKQRINGINQYGLTGKTLIELLPASSDFLFLKTAISDAYLIKPDEKLRQLKTDNIDYMYKQINVKSGLATPDGERNVFLSHQLRKFCDNQMVEANINSEYREFFLGHKPPGSQANYHKFAQKPDALKAEYLKAAPFLTIAKDLDITASSEFKRIEKDRDILLIEAEKHRVERSELQSIRAELEAEKRKQETWKSEIEKELKDALALNKQKKIEFSRELTDEEVSAIEEAANEYPQPIFKVPEGESPLQGLSDFSLDDIPEEESDIINRIFNSKEKQK